MTVWIFGASAAHLLDNEPDQWSRHLANSLNTDVRSLAFTGSSLDYMYYKFNEIRQDIKENDVIVISVIGFERQWLFKEYPHKSMLFSPPSEDKLVLEAIELYIRYLQSKEITEVYLINFLYNLNYISKNKNLKTILLVPYADVNEFFIYKKELFPHLHIAKGLLLEVSCNEIEKDILKRKQYISFDNDTRLNHFIKSNHLILSKKLYDYVVNDIPVNLTEGFMENVLTNEAQKDPQFIKNELFDNAVQIIYNTVS